MTIYEREAAVLMDMLCTFVARWDMYSDETKDICRSLWNKEPARYRALFRYFTDEIDRIEGGE